MEKTLQLFFSAENEQINPEIFGNFILQFNQTYRIATLMVGDIPPENILASPEEYKVSFSNKIADLWEEAKTVPGFSITQISFNSPS